MRLSFNLRLSLFLMLSSYLRLCHDQWWPSYGTNSLMKRHFCLANKKWITRVPWKMSTLFVLSKVQTCVSVRLLEVIVNVSPTSYFVHLFVWWKCECVDPYSVCPFDDSVCVYPLLVNRLAKFQMHVCRVVWYAKFFSFW